MVQRYQELGNIFSSHLDAERLAFRGLARETDATVGTEEGGRGRGGEWRGGEGRAGEGRWWQFVIESVGGGRGWRRWWWCGGKGRGVARCLSSLDSQVDCI